MPSRLLWIQMNKYRRFILGVPVDTYTQDELIHRIEQGIGEPGVKNILAINAEKVMGARKDLKLYQALKEGSYLIPDGIGAVLGLKLLHGENVSRITGIRLADTLLELAAKKDYKIFIFGSEPHVIQRASDIIRNRLRDLDLVGIQHGYIPQEEYPQLVKRINDSGADILLVALGSPMQEKWIHDQKKLLKVKICMGIGGSLDVLTGKVLRAPGLFQKLGLEWLFRLVREPSRFKRQLILPRFVLAVLAKRFLG